ncbi:MAG: site-specific DNA-methyltransferase [Candidatus Thiodiazotropha endolucinida]|nr:site-specific DNA-methyltransferase [Candidatus Thiodiazotropha taylori]MCW4264663.1 site-specific DNA-methyltransferase [Candidatus Thiodiazotropha endolucinida]
MSNEAVLVRPSDFQVLHDELIDRYKTLEKDIQINQIDTRVSYASPVNFNESMETPRHRWFPYKEGFSPSFVQQFIETHIGEEKEGIILDPFSGVGTTALVSSQLGKNAVGFDVSPLSSFVAETKSLTLDSDELSDLRVILSDFKNSKLTKEYAAPDNETVRRYYEPEFLGALLRVRAFIESIGSPKSKDLFFLAYLSILEEFSTHRKAGNGVKKKTRLDYTNDPSTPLDKIRSRILRLVDVYIDDLAQSKIITPPIYLRGSSIDSETYEDIEKISGVITSPPYANCFDYSKIYMRELWLGDFFKTKEDHKCFRSNSVRSHVHATWEERHPEYASDTVEHILKPILEPQKLWSNKIPSMLSGYFKDISRVLDLIGRKSAKGTRVGFVVSNSFYGGVPVATDLLISECALKVGFRTKSIDIYRGMIPSSQQYKLIEDKYFMRESLVVLEKQ